MATDEGQAPMAGYSSHPSAPMTREDTVTYLAGKYELTDGQANDLLDRAMARSTGMASHPRSKPGQRTVWATYMTTQNGKFIIEDE
jgi:hypothetical protein